MARRKKPFNRLNRTNGIPPEVRAEIIRWAQTHLFDQDPPKTPGVMEVHLFGGYEKNEGFLQYGGQDFYISGHKSKGHIEIQLRHLKTLKDLPVMLPSSIPQDLLQRLNEG